VAVVDREGAASAGDAPTLSGLARDSLIYVVGIVLVRAGPFFITPVLTRALVQDVFGALDVLMALQGMVIALTSLNLDMAVARYFYEHEADDRLAFVSSILWTLVGLGMAAALIVTAASGVIATRLFDGADYRAAVTIVGWTVPWMVVSTTTLSLLRFARQPVTFVLLSTFGVAVQIVAVVIAVRMFQPSVTSVLTAQAIAQAALAAAVVIRCRGYFRGRPAWSYLRRAFAFCLPQFPSVIITWYLASANRFYLLSLSTLAAVGLFAGASRINSVVVSLAQAFSNAWLPFAMSIMHTPRAKETYARVMYLVVGGLSLLTAIVAVTARPFLYYYAGPAYAPAATTAAILVLSTVVSQGLGWFLGLGLLITERPFYASVAQFVAFVVNTALNLWLIPGWGAAGAALAVLGGSIAQIAAVGFASNRFYPFRYNRLVWAGPTAAGLFILFARWAGLA